MSKHGSNDDLNASNDRSLERTPRASNDPVEAQTTFVSRTSNERRIFRFQTNDPPKRLVKRSFEPGSEERAPRASNDPVEAQTTSFGEPQTNGEYFVEEPRFQTNYPNERLVKRSDWPMPTSGLKRSSDNHPNDLLVVQMIVLKLWIIV